jgi:competence protein ComEC
MISLTKSIKRSFLPVALLLCFTAQACTDRYRPFAEVTQGETVIHFLDVGQGDSTLISFPNGEIMLVDAGDQSSGAKVSRHLRDLGIRRVDHLVFTHSHDDHIGGIFSVMRDIKVFRVYDSGLENRDSRIYGEYTRLARNDLSRYRILRAGDTLLFGEVTIEVLHPRPPPSGDVNNESIVLKARHGNISVILTGDIQEAGERDVLTSFPSLSGTILKVAHHGDRDASSDAFLERLQPEVAIVSVGRGNKYGRPHQEVMDRLARIGARIYRTDLHGDIILRTDGKEYSISTAR